MNNFVYNQNYENIIQKEIEISDSQELNKIVRNDKFLVLSVNVRSITKNINEYEEVINRPDIVVRVFHKKLKELKEEILKKEIFGKCIAYTYVIEFQKRGLPHVHMLIFLNEGNIIKCR